MWLAELCDSLYCLFLRVCNKRPAVSCMCLIFSRVVVLLGRPQPSLAGIGDPCVLTGTHRCALMPKVASKQSANPIYGWCYHEIMCLGRGWRDVLS